MKAINKKLDNFQARHNVKDKGSLSILVQLSHLLPTKHYPLDINDFLTLNKGQLAQLSGTALMKILKEHGITQKLTSEGGRTSRGGIALANHYIQFINELYNDGILDFAQVENYWIGKVKEYFHNLPFHLSVSPGKSFSSCINDLFSEVKRRQSEHRGTHFMGTMLQHLVAAKLRILLPNDNIPVYGASVADAPTAREGDFPIGATIIHCTTMPIPALMEKCVKNIHDGKLPVIITTFDRVQTALSCIDDAGLNGQVETWDIQQFLSTNVFEHSIVNKLQSRITIDKLIKEYNRIIDEVETDPSLKIQYGVSTQA